MVCRLSVQSLFRTSNQVSTFCIFFRGYPNSVIYAFTNPFFPADHSLEKSLTSMRRSLGLFITANIAKNSRPEIVSLLWISDLIIRIRHRFSSLLDRSIQSYHQQPTTTNPICRALLDNQWPFRRFILDQSFSFIFAARQYTYRQLIVSSWLSEGPILGTHRHVGNSRWGIGVMSIRFVFI